MSVEHISGPIARLFSRGDLPRRVLDVNTGRVIVWSEDDRAYQAGEMFVWPSFIRSQFGKRFFEATPATEYAMSCAR